MSSQGDPESEAALRLRITQITTSMAAPLHNLRTVYTPPSLPSAVPPGLLPSQVPVLRIFGTTPQNQKICANIHLCYPYFFVPYPMDSLDPLRPDRVIRLCQRFAVSLNHAICLALRQSPTGPTNAANFAGGTDPKHLHVISVMLVKGTPFYGYHLGYSYFLKVSLANPARVRVAVEQLHKPVVLGREWQPHEAHLSHVLQFMCDFDLYGCGILDLSGGTFREPLPEPGSSQEGQAALMVSTFTVREDMVYPMGLSPPRDTHCDLEIDVLPHQIMNRNRLQPRPLHHDFIELLHSPLDPEEKLVPAMKELWEDERRRRAARGLATSESAMLPVSGGGRGRTLEELGYKIEGQEVDNKGGNWKISEELWDYISLRMANERKKRGLLTFGRVSKDLRTGANGEKAKYDRWILTAFEAISAHWPKPFRAKPTQRSVKQSSVLQRESSAPLSSSPPPPSSPAVPDISEEEDNPFEILATQASQDMPAKVEVNHDAVQVAEDEEEEDPELQQHQKAVRQRAEEGQRIRATQAVAEDADFDDDEELDELFRQAIKGEERTPTKSRSQTPSSIGTMSTGRRREKRLRKLTEQAGFGDLSTIIDESFTLSSPTQNPYADPQTPTKQIRSQMPASYGSQATPSSLVRRSFGSRSRTARFASPTPVKPSPNALVLQESKRSVTHWTPSPQSPTPRARKKLSTPSPEEPLSEIKVERLSSQRPPPNAQRTPNTSAASLPSATTMRMLGATLHSHSRSTGSADSPTASKRPLTAALLQDDSSGSKKSPTSGERRTRPKKRVRVSSPVVESTPPHPSESIPNGSGSSGKPELSSTSWEFAARPPTLREVVDTMTQEGVEPVEYRDPFYSNPADVPPRPKLFAGRAFRLKGNDVQELCPFEYSKAISGDNAWLKRRRMDSATAEFGWEYAPVPPSFRTVVDYCKGKDEELAASMAVAAASQLARPTQKNKYGFKFTQKKSEREQRNMSVLSIEVFAPSRHQLKPDPAKDEIAAVFFCFQNDMESLPDNTRFPGYYAGYVVVDGPQIAEHRARLPGVPCHVVETELDLINWVIDAVKEWDPDVLTGWELHNSSWGYLSARAAESFDMEMTRDLSRMVADTTQNRKDGYSAHHTSTFKVNGRHTLNIWRIMRGEVNLNGYSFENVVFHVLHRRVPRYSAANLTALWKSKSPEHTARVLQTLFERVVIYAEVMDTAEIISKNAEFARVFGVDFDAVVFRGSQFKVESFLFRLAKPESFIMVTPSKQQVGLQNAPFAVPLIHEPESKYYNHPIIVLDFQSLYPSVMIAYNICYSTCLGRVEQFKGTNKFGFTELKVPDGLLELLKDYLTVTPNGMIFVKPAVRKSLLAKMLGEILDTRVMVKQAMKGYRDNKSLTQMLNARQLGLKLMANVTYGYTSATYSGRMPCIEVADSIVQTGRETLEKAQELINSKAEWGATVVYGDTDSLFVALPGRSKDEAFKIGHDIADTVTAMNPKPVKLKFEKVYMGSVLMAKKRYVGFKYEHPDDVEPVFDAKGIETIRRDGFPAQQKIEEIALKMLFKNQDLSEIKAYVQDEWRKILTGRVSLQDFIVAKEVRLGTYSEKGVPPPGAAVAYRRILKDPRDEVEYGERVPYIISDSSTGGKRLIDKARTPEEMLNGSLGIDKEYYIRNLLIPPLSRIFNLVGADVEQWYESMPRSKRVSTYGANGGGFGAGIGGGVGGIGGGGGAGAGGGGGNGGGRGARTTRIDAHFRSRHCLVCGAESGDALCPACRSEPASTAHALLSRQHQAHSRLAQLQRICASCAGTGPAERVLCDSIDCPTLYARHRAEKDVNDVADVPALVAELDQSDAGDLLDW